jgi:hypothetical protein
MKLLKWIVVLAVLFFAWKIIAPRIRLSHGASPAEATAPTGAGGGDCVGAASRAADAWGGGIGRFVNPPYDLDAWGVFRADVETKIGAAEASCASPGESHEKARSAMGDLRTLVSQLDSSIRGGTPPPDNLVQRQESIDKQIDEARELVRGGK